MSATVLKPEIGEFIDLPPAEGLPERVNRAIQMIRSHLGMDVAFISEFVDGRRYFRHVDGLGDSLPIHVGDSDPLEDSYCQRIIDGRLPELMQDAAANPVADALPVTRSLPVGAHLSVPIRLSDGRIYGTFCCFSHTPDPTLNKRDLQMMRAFAELTAHAIESDLEALNRRREKAERVRNILKNDLISIVYQPIFSLESNNIVGVEALSRFPGSPKRGADIWFAEAADSGMGAEMELLSVRKALADLAALPDEIFMTLNISPSTIVGGRLGKALKGRPLGRLGLEITEHAPIPDYARVNRVLRPLRKQGLRLAVDDAGAGYSSLRHVLNLKPDFIKLDVGLIRKIDKDSGRRAMASALVAFSQHTGSQIIAEGVETEAELDTLRKLGVGQAQGYLLGRPMPISKVLKLFTTTPSTQGPPFLAHPQEGHDAAPRK